MTSLLGQEVQKIQAYVLAGSLDDLPRCKIYIYVWESVFFDFFFYFPPVLEIEARASQVHSTHPTIEYTFSSTTILKNNYIAPKSS